MPSVFILGATGYIGGSLLVRLLKEYPDWTFSALVRNEKHFEAIRSAGVTVVPGSFTDKSLITDRSYSADIVINAADCDDIPLTEAILSGMRKRFQEGKQKGILIHTSGTGCFIDGKREGKFDPQGKIWNDTNEDDIRSITPAMPHGQVDVPILAAAGEGYINAYFICPGAILGPSTGPVKSATIFLKHFLSAFTAFKGAVYVGDGTSEFAFVHLDDLLDLYLRVIDTAVSGKDADASPYARYFFAASHGVAWKDSTAAVAAALHKRGRLDDATLTSVSITEDSHPYRFLLYAASSERVVAERGKTLGWNPRIFDLQSAVDETIGDALSLGA
ncbi:hypothetical protein OF83DRAFT_1066457 [Amylostereum chailletii]|nr:hypothetical protein OF83DRAFT_1066457 [Amylostereum chailletii]